MSDWSVATQDQSLGVLSVFGPDSLATELGNYGAVFGAVTTTWPTANRAVYVPFVVQAPVIVVKLFTRIATQSGNIDLGVYDGQKNRLVSSGSTAMAAAGIQIIDTTDTTLLPGVYYFAIAVDNTTATIAGTGIIGTTSGVPTLDLEAMGVLSQASAFALPNPAVWTAPAASTYLPMVGAMVQTTL